MTGGGKAEEKRLACAAGTKALPQVRTKYHDDDDDDNDDDIK